MSSYEHIVEPGEYLEKIAQAYDIPLEELLKYNPSITNPDIVFPGQRVQIPKFLAHDLFTPPPPESKTLLTNSSLSCCPGERTWVDVAYIPEQDMWLGLTEDGQRAFEEEEKRLDDALMDCYPNGLGGQNISTDTKRNALAKINQLGLLEGFKHSDHAYFLELLDKEDEKSTGRIGKRVVDFQYSQHLIRTISSVLATYKATGKLPNKEQEYVDFNREQMSLGNMPVGWTPVAPQEGLYAFERAWKVKMQARRGNTEARLNRLKVEAETHAERLGYEAYQGKFYRPESLRRQQAIQQYYKARLDREQHILNASDTQQTFFARWEQYANNPEDFKRAYPNDTNTRFYESVAALNRLKLAAREQSLLPEDFIGNPELVNTGEILSWETLIRVIYPLIGCAGPQQDRCRELGVWQLEHIKRNATRLIGERLQGLQSYFSQDLPNEVFEQALDIIQRCDKLLEAFNRQARARARANHVGYRTTNPNTLLGYPVVRSVWNSTDFQASPVQFKPKSAIRPVELTRLSTGERLRFVRSDWLEAHLERNKTELSPLQVTLARHDTAEIKKDQESLGKQLRTSLSNAISTDTAGLSINAKPLLEELDQRAEFTRNTVFTMSNHYPNFTPEGAQKYAVSEELSFFRYAAGASLSELAQFTPFDGERKLGEMSVTANIDLVAGAYGAEMYFPDSEGMDIYLPITAGEEHTPQRHFLGRLMLKCGVTLDGYVGASVALAPNLQLQSGDGSLVMRGDYVIQSPPVVPRTTLSTPNSPWSPSAPATGITGKVNAFAGVSLGGTISGEALWLPPSEGHDRYAGPREEARVKPGEWRSLCKLGTSVSVSAGIGMKADFLITIKNQRLVIVFDVSITKGIGAGSKVAFEIDPESLNELFNVIIGILKREGFRRLDIFDNDNMVYDALETLFTLAFLTGIAIGKLALLPLDVLRQMELEKMKEDSAQPVATYIVEKKPEQWYDGLLPETQGKLLNLLITEVDNGWFDDITEQQALEMENIQRQAINYLLKWTMNNGHSAGRQFEEAMTRMNDKGEKPSEDWYENKLEIYASYLRLLKFFNKGKGDTQNLGVHIRREEKIRLQNEATNLVNVFRGNAAELLTKISGKFEKHVWGVSYQNGTPAHLERAQNLPLVKKQSTYQKVAYRHGIQLHEVRGY